MTKFDIYAQYKENKNEVFNKIKSEYKSYFKLKFGYVLNKTRELNSHKKFIKENNNRKYNIGNLRVIDISGIIKENVEEELDNLVKKLPKYSFAIWIRFKLKAPYFSKDDDEFYIIQNPIMKDYAFKVPMIRASSWKGALANAFKELIKEEKENKIKLIESYLRIFGAGSESIKVIENYLKGKSENLEEFKKNLLEFLLFELGLDLKIEKINKIKNENDEQKLFEILKKEISKKLKKIKKDEIYPIEFQTHKGRLIVYPTFFDKLSLEIINPHDRRKRAGINPIHYEVVPKGAEGILQLVYVPFDGILKGDDELKEEVKEDWENLINAIKKLSKLGVGAKTKLGWGTFEITKSFSKCNNLMW